jgi:hypothetical protein
MTVRDQTATRLERLATEYDEQLQREPNRIDLQARALLAKARARRARSEGDDL